LLQTSTLKKLVILNSPAQTLLHFLVNPIFCPGRQRVIGAIITRDKLLQFTLISRFPAAQGAAPTFMHLPVFPLHSPSRHGDNCRFGLYITASPRPSSHKSSMKDVVDMIPERTLCAKALVFTVSVIVYTSMKIKIIFELKFILMYFFARTFNRFF
jgi:hypothetical protein